MQFNGKNPAHHRRHGVWDVCRVRSENNNNKITTTKMTTTTTTPSRIWTLVMSLSPSRVTLPCSTAWMWTDKRVPDALLFYADFAATRYDCDAVCVGSLIGNPVLRVTENTFGFRIPYLNWTIRRSCVWWVWRQFKEYLSGVASHLPTRSIRPLSMPVALLQDMMATCWILKSVCVCICGG